MTFQEYKTYFDNILKKADTEQQTPYDNPDYLDYTKLNWSRMNRWLKTGKLSGDLLNVIKKINTPQRWIVITEPWCGDAAHNIPFIEMAANHNPLISVSYELRDTAPFLIDQYLTNGTRSIPKLIIRNENGHDLATWGPRPVDCQKVYAALTAENASFEKVKLEIQTWYNGNKGVDVQDELRQLVAQTI
ncbi:MAG TPA: thioredoxin family protein [Cyclobacteriaceae bacterium]|nr:thioredoxin family protein [Cyclobacteriaceae bacterium]